MTEPKASPANERKVPRAPRATRKSPVRYDFDNYPADFQKLLALLRSKREAQRLTAYQVSLRGGMSPITVGDLETKCLDVRLTTLVKTCSVLGVKPSDVLREVGL